MAVRKMHQTTVRFGTDLWAALEAECSALGVSVAQFVRESALARLHYLAGRRGDPDYEVALELAGASRPEIGGAPVDPVASTLDHSAAEVSASSALWAQGRQARRKAQQLRDQSERRRHVR